MRDLARHRVVNRLKRGGFRTWGFRDRLDRAHAVGLLARHALIRRRRLHRRLGGGCCRGHRVFRRRFFFLGQRRVLLDVRDLARHRVVNRLKRGGFDTRSNWNGSY